MAGSLTYLGEIRLLQERFKTFTYRSKPTAILPANYTGNNTFERASLSFYSLAEKYVEGYFAEHGEKIAKYMDTEIKVSYHRFTLFYWYESEM